MKIHCCIPFLAVLLCCASSAVSADEIVITHRSGKVQTIRIEQPDDPVEQVSFRRGAGEAPRAARPDAPAAPAASAAPAAPAAPTVPEPAQKPERSGIKVKWASPMDAPY